MSAHPTCPFCGVRLSEAARYCDRCGTPLQPAGSPATRRRRENRSGRVAVWAFVLILFVLFGAGTLGGYRVRAGQWPALPAGAPRQTGTNLPDYQGPDLEQPVQDPVVAEYLRSVVSVNASGNGPERWGSGFVIDSKGHVLTAAHVVEEARGCVNVVDDNGRSHQGTVLAVDKTLDVALLHVSDMELWPTRLDLSPVPAAVGDSVYVLGSPKGVGNPVHLSATVNRTGDDRDIEGRYHQNTVQVSGAVVIAGTSGGPMVSKVTGKAVGVVIGSGGPAAVAWARPTGDILSLVQHWSNLVPASTCQREKAVQTIPLTLLTITPRTGANGVEGEDLADGAELALRELDSDLRAVGYEVTLKREDDGGLADIARAKVADATQDPRVIGAVGSLDNYVTKAVAEALRPSGLPLVAPTAGGSDLTTYGWSHFNRVVASSDRQEQALANAAKDLFKAGFVYILEDGSAEAATRVANFRVAAQIIALPTGAPAQVSVSSDMERLKEQLEQAQAQAVYYAGDSTTALHVIKSLRQFGVNLPFLGGQSAFAPSTFLSYTGAGAQGVYFTRLTSEPAEQFRRNFETVWGKPTRGYAVYGHDAATVILRALIRYGEDNPAKTPGRYELARLVRQTQGLRAWSSYISFDQHGENQTSWLYLYEWKQGTPEYRANLQ
ncbi:MAG TPA: ABC transporter substrate-binding protein [Symbiobacteriaceae bacterium]|nr:ABC transporter substrate-binding protein [Symbiobacteriaceae bacterium]